MLGAATIRQRLTRFGLLTVGFACLIIALFGVVEEFVRTQKKLHADIQVLLDIGSDTVQPYLAFADPAGARTHLQSLLNRPDIVAAGIYLPEGYLFAAVDRQEQDQQTLAARSNFHLAEEPGWLPTNFLRLSHPVNLDGEQIGELSLLIDLRPMRHEQLSRIAGILLAMCLAMLASWFLARRLQRLIIAPIAEIADTAAAIRESGHYNLRVSYPADDEIGHLVRQFNAMLGKIADTDHELRRHRDHLEGEVLARTRDLCDAKDIAERETAAALRANAAKTEFLSRMSHELRTPLNAIIGFSQMLEAEGTLNPEQADDVREIRKAGNLLLAQVNEILDLSRIESGHLELIPEVLDLDSEITAAVNAIRPLLPAQQLQLQLAPVPNIRLYGDRQRLQQILLNLLSNAVKYNRQGGRIEIHYGGNSNAPRICITDSGRGLSTEQLARLFRPFERLESAYCGIEGTGIGLALCKRLVEAMGGSIGVESQSGQGSTFWFELPAAPTSGDALTATSEQVCHSVLYIEDNAINAKLMQKVLDKRPDVRLRIAEDGLSGLAAVSAEMPELILLDLNLPDIDGFEVMHRLGANPVWANIPVIAVTANNTPADIARGQAAGFLDYLGKPLDVRRLNAALDKLWATPTQNSTA
ncbi:ATP-binding protein [Dechloromonas sp. ZY10]|uniref:ATP-binding protein n=1 Tax=Dechloromonas aquae TaxID=2664436 RepID=UPI003527C91D